MSWEELGTVVFAAHTATRGLNLPTPYISTRCLAAPIARLGAGEHVVVHAVRGSAVSDAVGGTVVDTVGRNDEEGDDPTGSSLQGPVRGDMGKCACSALCRPRKPEVESVCERVCDTSCDSVLG